MKRWKDAWQPVLLTVSLPGLVSAASPDQPDVVMFSSDYCPPCLHAKQHFDEHQIDARIFDVDESPAARSYFEKLGGRGLPLIFVDNKRLEGYSPERFEQLYEARRSKGRE